MYRAGLISALNRHVWLQYILGILPIFMVMIYGYAYLTDMLGIARNLMYNDNISERSWEVGELREVSNLENDGPVAHVTVRGDDDDIVEVGVDDVIFYVQIFGPDWYQLVTGNGNAMMLQQCDLFDLVDYNDDSVTVTHDDISLDFEYGDIICGVSVSEDELWQVSFIVEGLPHYDLEELHMVELLGSEDGRYEVLVTGSYNLDVEDFELNFCTNLPTDNMYYDESTGSFVQNVSKDYAWTFMLRSNIAIVLLSTLMLCFLLYKAMESKELSLLKSPYILRVNIFGFCLLLICVPFTLIML